ncbi:hypothetical protein H4219_003252 [Mycoemilia scoparia]|uniref:HMG box domain-containing protein n=1 Tax=Mycoemilia scoparia TaxID=417184 RepID=A0A9W7ZV99_9FUNG|nr:hypothetical protein H4219_003252 [Mycoemilia scoparia]
MTSDFTSLLDDKSKVGVNGNSNNGSGGSTNQHQHHQHHQQVSSGLVSSHKLGVGEGGHSANSNQQYHHHSHSLSHSHNLPHSHSHARTLSLSHPQIQHQQSMLSSGMFATPSATPTSMSSHHPTPNGAEHAEMIERATMNLLANAIATPSTPGNAPPHHPHHQSGMTSVTHADLAQASQQLTTMQQQQQQQGHHQQQHQQTQHHQQHHHQPQQQSHHHHQSQSAQYLLAAAGVTNGLQSKSVHDPNILASMPLHTNPASTQADLNGAHGHHMGGHHNHTSSVSSVGTPSNIKNGNGVIASFSSAEHSNPDSPSAQHSDSGAGSTKPLFKRFRNSFIYFVNEQRKIRNPSENKIKNSDFIQSMKELWHSMSEEDKKPYIDMANKDKERYEADVKKYGRLPVRKKASKLSSPSASNHPLTSPTAAAHGSMTPITPNGFVDNSSVPVTPDWRHHQFGMNMMLGAGAHQQGALASPHHPHHQPHTPHQMRGGAAAGGYPPYMSQHQGLLHFNMQGGNGVVPPHHMAMAMLHQSPGVQHPQQTTPQHQNFHLNGMQSIVTSGSVPSALASPLHNPNGTLRKHIPGTKRKLTPDGKPMTKLPLGVKRFRNSFLYYANEHRKKMGEETKSFEGGDKNREFIRKMAAQWNQLTDEEKAPYVKMAEEDKERYYNELAKQEEKEPGQGPKIKRKKLTVSVPGKDGNDDANGNANNSNSANGGMPATAAIHNGSESASMGYSIFDPISAPPTLSRDPTRPPPTPSAYENGHRQQTQPQQQNHHHHHHHHHSLSGQVPGTSGLQTITEQAHEPSQQGSVAPTTMATVGLEMSASELMSAFTQGVPDQGLYIGGSSSGDVNSILTSSTISRPSMNNGHVTNGSMETDSVSGLTGMMSMSAAELSAMSSIAPTPATQPSPPVQTPGAGGAPNGSGSHELAKTSAENLDHFAKAIEQANAAMIGSVGQSNNQH